jgi:hypothetical protein
LSYSVNIPMSWFNNPKEVNIIKFYLRLLNRAMELSAMPGNVSKFIPEDLRIGYNKRFDRCTASENALNVARRSDVFFNWS